MLLQILLIITIILVFADGTNRVDNQLEVSILLIEEAIHTSQHIKSLTSAVAQILPPCHERYSLDIAHLQWLRVLDLPAPIRRLELIPMLDKHTTLTRRLKVHFPAHARLISAIRSLTGDGVLDIEREFLRRVPRAENELQTRRVGKIQRKIALCTLRSKARTAESLGIQMTVEDGLRGA